MTSLSVLKAKRQSHILNAKKQLSQVQTAWENKPQIVISAADLSVIHSKLQKYEQTIDSLTQQIEEQIDPEALVEELASSTELNETIWEALSQITFLLSASEVPSHCSVSDHGTNSVAGSNSISVKLPKLEISSFDGNPLQWQEFWDTFETTIHVNEVLSTIDKFKYLKSYLQGEAKRVVEGFRLTAAKYTTVIETLQERFGNSEVAVFAHFEKLHSLQVCNPDTASLQKAYDECEKHVRSLVALGLTEDTFGQVFTPIIISKVPREVQTQLYRRKGSDPWTLSLLRELFRDEISARTMGDWSLGYSTPEGGKKPKESKGSAQSTAHKASIPTTGAFSNSSKSAPTCIFCKESHYADQCKKYPTADARKAVIRGQCCYKCLKKGHNLRNFTQKKNCFFCKDSGHHSSLCLAKFGKAEKASAMLHNGDTEAANEEAPSSQLTASASAFVPQKHVSGACVNGSVIHMQMAVVNFAQFNVSARIFFDVGSSCSYITSTLANAMNLRADGKTRLSNARFGDSRRQSKMYPRFNLSIPTLDGSIVPISVFSLPNISCSIQKWPLNVENSPVLNILPLADPPTDYVIDVPIDILIGNDHYYDFVGSEQIRLDGGLVLLGSKLGYITAGRVERPSPGEKNRVVSFFNHSFYDTTSNGLDVQKFWSLENIGIHDDGTQIDNEVAVQRTVKLVDGRYQVGWPWKSSDVELPDNYDLALSRLRQLNRRLRLDEKVCKVYDDKIQKQLESGVIEEVNDPKTPNRIHYIPHHCVVHPDKSTTKLRVVYDASSKVNRSLLSLNECLFRGPVFLGDLCGLLLRFRTYTVALIADIEKAFLQVSLQPTDRDVTRFLWLKDPTKPVYPDNMVTFRFVRVPFGVISNPFLLAATIKHHLKQQGTEIANHISENIYVDNSICGRQSLPDAKVFYIEAKRLFQNISMNLREWYSKSTEFMEILPDQDMGKDSVPKVLEMCWNTKPDTIFCSNPKTSEVVVSNKRQFLQAASRVFDPCRLVSPVVIRAKLLVQETWKRQIFWEDHLPDDLKKEWSSCAIDLDQVSEIQVHRLVCPQISSDWQLHCFCDASAKVYAATVYLQPNNVSGNRDANLVFSKSRLAPIKKILFPDWNLWQ